MGRPHVPGLPIPHLLLLPPLLPISERAISADTVGLEPGECHISDVTAERVRAESLSLCLSWQWLVDRQVVAGRRPLDTSLPMPTNKPTTVSPARVSGSSRRKPNHLSRSLSKSKHNDPLSAARQGRDAAVVVPHR